MTPKGSNSYIAKLILVHLQRKEHN